jgi:carbonic anhydrase
MQDAAAMTDSSPQFPRDRPGLMALAVLACLSGLAGPSWGVEPAAKGEKGAVPVVAAPVAPAVAAPAAAPASAGRGPTAMRTPYRPRKAAPAERAETPPEPSAGAAVQLGPGDPLDRLRERLASRSGPGTSSKTGLRGTPVIKVDNQASGEFIVKAPAAGAAVTRVPGATRAPPVAQAATGAGASAKHAAEGAMAAHGPAWGYAGALGAQSWPGLHPSFSLCGSGQRQSPVDIRDGLPVDLEAVDFLYRPGFFSVTDNGHTVQVQVGGGNAIEVGARRYELTGFHFHLPGEERVDGRAFAMSIHLVHRDAQGRLAVVALVVEEGTEHPAVQAVWNNLPLERGEFVAASVEFDPTALLPPRRGYYTYMGSLTTPPCTEGVLWVVMQQPVQVSPQQLAIFARLHPMNARPIQPLNGRVIKQSR